MDIKNLDISPELREKAKACKTPEEMLTLAKAEGCKLSEAELEEVAGGGSSVWGGTEKIECVQCGTKFDIDKDACPNCGQPVFTGHPEEY